MDIYETKRFHVIFEKHIGFGIRWQSCDYALELSIGIPFVSFIFGLGRALLVTPLED